MEPKRQIPGLDGKPLSVTGIGFRPAGEYSNEHLPDDGTEEALGRLIGRWADAAVSHAVVRCVDDPVGLVATVAGIEGAWGCGGSAQEALQDLHSVLIDWASLKLEDGDDDIPSMEGAHLVVV